MKNRFATRRRRARLASRCIVCCRREPPAERSVCPECNEAAKQRMRERRMKGADSARRDLRSALSLAKRLGVSGRIDDAMAAYAIVKGMALASQDFESAVKALAGLSALAWARCDTPAALSYAEEILALPSPPTSLWRIEGYLRCSRQLATLDRPQEALALLQEAARNCAYARLESLSTYLEIRGFAESRLGQRSEALQDFRVARELSVETPRPGDRAFILNNFAVVARNFGETSLAKQLFFEAVDFAESKKLGWVTTHIELSLADSYVLWGEFSAAHDLVRRQEGRFNDHPTVLLKLLTLRSLLDPENIAGEQRTGGLLGDDRAMDITLRSKESQRIGYVLPAIAHRLRLAGDVRGSARVIDRALEALCTLDNTWNIWLLTAECALFGNLDQLRALRDILEKTKIDDDISRGNGLLISAAIEKREGRTGECRAQANRAARYFGAAGWRLHAALSLDLADRTGDAKSAYRAIGADSYLSSLTARPKRGRPPGRLLSLRQQQVAVMAARGASNAQIGSSLGISRQTTAHHVSAVFQILDVKRRSEIREALEREPVVFADLLHSLGSSF